MGTLNNFFFPYPKRKKEVISLVFALKGGFKTSFFKPPLFLMLQNLLSCTYSFHMRRAVLTQNLFSKFVLYSGLIHFMMNIGNPVFNMKRSMIRMKPPISEMKNLIFIMKECMLVKQHSMCNTENFKMNMKRSMFIIRRAMIFMKKISSGFQLYWTDKTYSKSRVYSFKV